MKKNQRRKFSSDFKAKVVLEALKERETMEEIARRFELHPNQVGIWKKEFLANAGAAFGGGGEKEAQAKKEEDMEKLYARIGQLQVENDWLKKKLQ